VTDWLVRSVIGYSLPIRPDLETDLLPNRDWLIRLPRTETGTHWPRGGNKAAFDARSSGRARRAAGQSGVHATELVPTGIASGRCGASPCENVREPGKRSVIFPIAFFG
jgi:hypothetical protein